MTFKEYADKGFKGWVTDDKEILRLRGYNGNTIAHILAAEGNWTTDDEEILKLTSDGGYSVAHILAIYNEQWITNDKKILKLETKTKRTVAQELIMQEKWFTNDLEILQIRLKDPYYYADWTIAHLQVLYGWTTDDPEMLKQTTPDGVPIALIQAEKGWSTNDKEILKIADEKTGWSVAHALAAWNPTWTTDDEEVLNLKDRKGIVVKDILIDKGKLPANKQEQGNYIVSDLGL